MTDDKTRQLENRIDKLEKTIEKMMPSRRDALKMGGAALIGGAAMSGTASAGTNQVGTIGDKDATPPKLVDLHSEDIDNADTITTDSLTATNNNNTGTVTTDDLVVNGTATGPFGGGGIVLEAGDSITVRSLNAQTTDGGFVTLYSGGAKDVLGGVINGGFQGDFLYEFTDATTIRKNGTGTNYSGGFTNNGFNTNDENMGDINFLPPARDVVKIRVGAKIAGGFSFGADVILKD